MSGIMQNLLACRGPGPAFVSSSFAQVTSGSLVITKPASVVSGMLLIAVMASAVREAGNTWSGDTGWNERFKEANFPNLRIATLIAGAAEPASYTFVITGAAQPVGGYILAFERATYDNIGAVGESSGATDCIAPSTTFSLNGLLLAFFAKTPASGTFTTPAGMTTLVTDSDATAPSIAVFSQFANIGATGTRTATPSATGSNAGILMGLI